MYRGFLRGPAGGMLNNKHKIPLFPTYSEFIKITGFTPSFLTRCQEASGNIIDESPGAHNLTVLGANLLYRKPVRDCLARGIGINGSSFGFGGDDHATVWPGASSFAIFTYFHMPDNNFGYTVPLVISSDTDGAGTGLQYLQIGIDGSGGVRFNAHDGVNYKEVQLNIAPQPFANNRTAMGVVACFDAANNSFAAKASHRIPLVPVAKGAWTGVNSQAGFNGVSMCARHDATATQPIVVAFAAFAHGAQLDGCLANVGASSENTPIITTMRKLQWI